MKLAYGMFYTNNMKAATLFYEETLGLKKAFGDDRFIAFKIGDALLGIKIVEKPREVPGHQTIILEVPDIEEVYESFKTKGLNIDKELTTEDWGKNFSILDPDLNKVEFFQK